MSQLPLALPTDGNPRLTVLSFGAGQDSTALLYLYAFDHQRFRKRFAPGEFLVLMSDTGDEHPATYAHVAEVEAFCREHRIRFHFIRPEDGCHSEAWRDLRSFYRRTATCGSKVFQKSCTDNLKLRPFYAFLNGWVAWKFGLPAESKRWRGKAALVAYARQWSRIQVLLGIAAGEEGRVGDPKKSPRWMQESVFRRYPLIELEMDRAACQRYIAGTGRPVPPPSNCMLCPYASEIEVLWLATRHPQDFAEWVGIEAAKLRKFAHKGDRNFPVFPERPLEQVLARAREQYGHLSPAELDAYKFSHGHCVRSKY